MSLSSAWQDHTSAVKLDTNANNFERGQKDVFRIKAVDLGELVKAVVKKDSAGMGGDWHLQSIDVFHPGTCRMTLLRSPRFLIKRGGYIERGGFPRLQNQMLGGQHDVLGAITC